MQIKNLMSEDLITVDKDQNLSDALKLLRKHNVSRLPVTSSRWIKSILRKTMRNCFLVRKKESSLSSAFRRAIL